MNAARPRQQDDALASNRGWRGLPLTVWVRLSIAMVLSILWLLFGAVKVYLYYDAQAAAQETLTRWPKAMGNMRAQSQHSDRTSPSSPSMARTPMPTPPPHMPES